ncbi:VP8 [Kundal virus]|uniref:VP8 n=1 Tax=Kundal virus TaxID=2290890 RepID=A0A499RFI9_9REOV|nr:VP8 [Kundal virus]AXG65500.1 VP8 [Kundal virus]
MMLRQPVKYNIFLLPTGRKLLSKTKQYGTLDRLPLEDWKIYEAIENKLKYAIHHYPFDWRQRITFHEKNGFKMAILVPNSMLLSDYKESIKQVITSLGHRPSDIMFVDKANYTKRHKHGKIVIYLDTEMDLGIDGFKVDSSKYDSTKMGKILGAMLQSKLLCSDFIKPINGCKYEDVGNLLPQLLEKDRWILSVQANYHHVYGRTRSIEVGMVEDFFASEGVCYTVKDWHGAVKYEGSIDSFNGRLMLLPSTILTPSEYERQTALSLRMKKSKNILSAFMYITFQLKIDPYSLAQIPGLSHNDKYSVIVPTGTPPPRGFMFGEDFASRYLSKAISTSDRKSKIAITIVSGISWNVEILGCSPCVNVIDGSDYNIIREILEFPNRIIILGRKGSGKSRLSKMFAKLGYNIIDSDTYGRLLHLCKDTYTKDNFERGLGYYLRLTKEERDGIPSVFELQMEALLQKFKKRGLPSYCELNDAYVGRLDRDLFLAYDKVYDKLIRTITPEDCRNMYLEKLWSSGGFDDLGFKPSLEKKAVIFCHTLAEQFQAMSAVLVELIPAHSTRTAVKIRGQGYSADSELYLHDYYVSKNGNGAPKVGLGWLTHLLQSYVPEDW